MKTQTVCLLIRLLMISMLTVAVPLPGSSAVARGKARAIDAAARARTSSDVERIRQLVKQNRLLQQERDILRKAAQYCVKEMGL